MGREQNQIHDLLTRWVTTADMAELICTVWPQTDLKPRTPAQWDFRRRNGQNRPTQTLPDPDTTVGPTRRPLWRAWVIVRWYAEREGKMIPERLAEVIEAIEAREKGIGEGARE